MHPMVLGELACGNLKNRTQLLAYFKDLPFMPEATSEEVLFLIENKQLMGKGIGFIDAHLLTSVLLFPEVKLWTGDKRLSEIAIELGCTFSSTDQKMIHDKVGHYGN